MTSAFPVPAATDPSQGRSAAFHADGLAVMAGGRRLLEDVAISLLPGEVVAIVGPSGGGKTTLLRALAGLDAPADGQVTLHGRAPGDWGVPAFRRRVVLVEQRPTLLEGTVEDNLRRPFTYRSAAGKPYPAQAAAAWLDRLAVGADRLSQEARTLSVGQQQRACLVRALLLEPDVLLLDEPTSALDADAAGLVGAALRQEADQRGLAALAVTHWVEQAQAWCDRVFSIAPHVARPEGEV